MSPFICDFVHLRVVKFSSHSSCECNPCQFLPSNEEVQSADTDLKEGFAVLPVLVPHQVWVCPVHGRVETPKGVDLPLVINNPVTASRLWAGALNWTNLRQLQSFELQLKTWSPYLLELKKVKCVHVVVLLLRLLTDSLSQVSSFCLASLNNINITPVSHFLDLRTSDQLYMDILSHMKNLL